MILSIVLAVLGVLELAFFLFYTLYHFVAMTAVGFLNMIWILHFVHIITPVGMITCMISPLCMELRSSLMILYMASIVSDTVTFIIVMVYNLITITPITFYNIFIGTPLFFYFLSDIIFIVINICSAIMVTINMNNILSYLKVKNVQYATTEKLLKIRNRISFLWKFELVIALVYLFFYSIFIGNFYLCLLRCSSFITWIFLLSINVDFTKRITHLTFIAFVTLIYLCLAVFNLVYDIYILGAIVFLTLSTYQWVINIINLIFGIIFVVYSLVIVFVVSTYFIEEKNRSKNK